MRSTDYQDIVAQTITEPFPCGAALLEPGFPDCRLPSSIVLPTQSVLGMGNSVKDHITLFQLSDVHVLRS
jgi:hypothetical protein